MTFRMVPPAGIPVRANDICKLIGLRFTPAKATADLRKILAEITGAKHIFFINSGRAANYIILKSLKKMENSKRDEVVIPAYTCFSIPASIVRAGLKIRPIDIDPLTFDYSHNALNSTDFTRVLAILPCNLFGIVSDWKIIGDAISGKDIYTIDDSAQTLGLPVQNRVSGTMGDVGFYSLGRGKNMTTYSGGVILTDRSDLAGMIDSEIAALIQPGIAADTAMFIKLLLYGIFLKPAFYWLPDNLPFLRLGYTKYDTNFEIAQFSKLQYCSGAVMFPQLQEINAIRSFNVSMLIHGISNIGNFIIPAGEKSDHPYIRLPVLAPDNNTRNKIIQKLSKLGIVTSGMYPSTVAGIAHIKNFLVGEADKFCGAETVVNRLFTLPTHPYVTERDIEKIINCLKSI